MLYNTLLFQIALLPTLTSSVLLPLPPGPSNVTVTTGPITDTSRIDPYAPSPTTRSLMLSIFQPSVSSALEVVPYMLNLTSTVDTAFFVSQGFPSNLSLGELQQQLCQYPSEVDEEAPLVLFSPGLGGPRQVYSQLAAAVSSYGYTVVAMDHTYEAPVVEFPDGATIYANATASNSTDEALFSEVLATRTADVSSVLDALSDGATVGSLLAARGAKPFDTSCTTMFGHSLGGATAALAMVNESRLLGGIDMDGTLFGSVVSTGSTRPFIIFERDGPSDRDASDSWNAIWPNSKGFRLLLQLKGSLHDSFSDAIQDLEAFGIDTTVSPYNSLLGTIKGVRDIEVISRYVTAFFERIYSGQPQSLLQQPSDMYPEIAFIKQ